MTISREASPDWLRSFQAPGQSVLSLSSDSEHSPTNSPIKEDEDRSSSLTALKNAKSLKKAKDQDSILIDISEDSPVRRGTKSKSTVTRAKQKMALKVKGSRNLIGRANNQRMKDGEGAVANEHVAEKQIDPHVSSSLPLVMSEKVLRSKVLVECEGDSIDLSGDLGAVGRVVISDAPSGNHEMLLDLKGTIYKTTIVPSRTFCVVSFGQAEAKVEAIMNDFIQLTPQSNVYEAETMLEGTLDGFSFDSEEEADKTYKPDAHQNDQKHEADKPTEGKKNKALGVNRKKGKMAVKPPNKGKRNTQGPKKTKNAKK
ncbi:hypothetical protein Syun_024790 [Stephania yunnanensis]|uniref:DNA-binding protein BIN4 n=1 Tax=Stephania yunnanensis TaxID=152371 RepID=A0AAP0ET00_9MAGN